MLRKLLLLCIIPFCLCSCTKDVKEEITFSSWGSITETQIIEKIILDFEKENPNLKVNFIHIPQNYFQKLHLLFASSQAPDVVFINNLYLPLYANKFEDLSQYINTEEFYPQAIEALTISNKILAAPRDISNLVIYINKDYISQEIESNWTFNDFVEILDKLNGYKYYPISFERDVYFANPYIATLGENEGLMFYKKLEGKYAPKPSDVGSSTLAQMFLDKKICMYLSGRWMYPKISQNANFKYEILPFPGTTYADASGWALLKESKHKNASIKFIKYLSSKNSIDFFTNTGLIVPARMDSAQILNNKKENAFLTAINKSKTRKISRNYKKNIDDLNKKLFN